MTTRISEVYCPDRIPCLIVGCRRTAPKDRYPPNTVIICGKHYRMAPKWLRRRKTKIERLMRRRGCEEASLGTTKPGSPERRLVVMLRQCWDKIVAAAQEAARGI